jgi:hypothetical protein
MKTYKIEREITVKVYDYIEAESQEDAQNKVDNMPSLLCEISDTGLKNRHIAVAYVDYGESVDELGDTSDSDMLLSIIQDKEEKR